MKLRMINYDPMTVITLKVTDSTAVDVGEMLQYVSGTVLPMDEVGDDATFCGISLGKALTSETGKEIAIAQRCICEATLTSAAYVIGNGLLWASATSLAAATSGANQIAWFYDWKLTGQTVTSGYVLFDVLMLAVNADKLFESSNA